MLQVTSTVKLQTSRPLMLEVSTLREKAPRSSCLSQMHVVRIDEVGRQAWFFILAAVKRALPPGAAHASKILSPG